jgi:hypothetical protein
MKFAIEDLLPSRTVKLIYELERTDDPADTGSSQLYTIF